MSDKSIETNPFESAIEAFMKISSNAGSTATSDAVVKPHLVGELAGIKNIRTIEKHIEDWIKAYCTLQYDRGTNEMVVVYDTLLYGPGKFQRLDNVEEESV